MCSLKRNQRLGNSANLLAAQKGVPGQPAKRLSNAKLGTYKSNYAISAIAKRNEQSLKNYVSQAAVAGSAISSSPNSFHSVQASETKNLMSPLEVGLEFLTGTGPRQRVFRNMDEFTRLLKEHHHLHLVRAYLSNAAKQGVLPTRGSINYRLTGSPALPFFIEDVKAVMALGIGYNMAITYLGSFGLDYKIISRNKLGKTLTVEFHVYNESTIRSLTRPPRLSDTEFWRNGVSPTLNSFFNRAFATGPLSPIRQDFYWVETLEWH